MLTELYRPIQLEDALRGNLPQKYVRSLAAPDLYFALQEVSEDTRREVLALALPEQVQGILDLDSWEESRLDLMRLRDWYHSLTKAMPPGRLAIHLREIDAELLVALVVSEFEVFPIGPDFEAGAPGTDADWQSPDGKFWLYRRATPLREDSELAGPMLDLMYQIDDDRARGILMEAAVGLLSELEETAFRFREARLTDMGFPPADVAAAIWDPRRTREVLVTPDEATRGRYMAVEVAHRSSLRQHLEALPEQRQADVGAELVVLANAAIMSEGLPVRERESVELALGMVAGYLDLALEIEEGRKLLAQSTTQAVFQLGLGRVSGLNRRARGLLASGVFDQWGRTLTLLSVPERAFLENLARRHPLFADPSIPEARVRPFARQEDLVRSEATLARLETAATVLFAPDGLAGQTDAWQDEALLPPREERTIDSLVGTLLARIVLQLPVSIEPVSRGDIRKLLASIDRLADFRGAIEQVADASQPLGAWMIERSEHWLEDLRGAGGNPALVTAVLHYPEG